MPAPLSADGAARLRSGTVRCRSGAAGWCGPRLRGGLVSGQPGDVEPVGDLVRAALAGGDGDGVAPGRGDLPGPLEKVVEDVRGGLGLDQAAQAEPDVPALVALDPLDALAHPGQGAVGQIVEQRLLPGVED